MSNREGKSETNYPGNGYGLAKWRPMGSTEMIFFHDEHRGKSSGSRHGYGKGRASGFGGGIGSHKSRFLR